MQIIDKGERYGVPKIQMIKSNLITVKCITFCNVNLSTNQLKKVKKQYCPLRKPSESLVKNQPGHQDHYMLNFSLNLNLYILKGYVYPKYLLYV